MDLPELHKFEEFSGWFVGKTSPVQLVWHSFDSLTRFSGRPGLAIESDLDNREAYTHEVILFGFWMGDEKTGWDVTAFESAWCPTAEQLRRLRSSYD